MGTICGLFRTTGETVAFDMLRTLGNAMAKEGEAREAYLSGACGLWQSGGALLSRACEEGNVTVLLTTGAYETLAPTADTVLDAYLTHGLGFFSHLFGPYALAVFDERTARVVLARDGAGRVPLAYGFFGGRLCFLSHPDRMFGIGLRELPPDTCHVFSREGYERLKRL